MRRRDVFQVARADVAFRRLLAPALYRREPLEALIASLVGNLETLPTHDAQLATLIRRGDPTQTRVNVHGATREELEAGTGPAVAEFPGGVVENARLLRPGLRFYEAEILPEAQELTPVRQAVRA